MAGQYTIPTFSVWPNEKKPEMETGLEIKMRFHVSGILKKDNFIFKSKIQVNRSVTRTTSQGLIKHNSDDGGFWILSKKS